MSLKTQLSKCHVSVIKSILPTLCLFYPHPLPFFETAVRNSKPQILRWFIRLDAVGLLMLLIACSCVPLDCKIRVCGCMATVFKGMTINKYERNRILHPIKWGSLKIRKQSFPHISVHSTSIFDVCSCMGTSRMEVQETEQRDILQMFS